MEKEINNLIAGCNKKPYKSKESILELKIIYEKLLQLRSNMILQNPGFPRDLGIEAIINLLDEIAHTKIEVKKAEWTYDHYIDLFKFKAEELLLESLEMMKKPERVLNFG
jgi:hypothetical protein